MATPESPAPDFNQLMDGIASGSVSLSTDAPRIDADQEPVNSENETETEVETEQPSSLQQFLDSEDGEEQEESAEPEPDSETEDSEPEPAKQAKQSKDIEEVTVTDTKGRRKVKVDFSDREKLKKYVALAHGGRKWQKERDTATAELGKVQSEYKTIKSDFDKLEEAYQSGGVAGLVNLLEGRKDAFDNWYQQEAKRREAFDSMTDSERRSYQLEQEQLRRDSENQKLREEYESKLSKIQEEKEITETRALESRLHPAFDRYRFSGKLGDEVAEHHYDQAIWNQALSNLEQLPNEIEITQAMIDKEFRTVSSAFRKVINKQVQSGTKKAVEQQKKSATTKAQAKVSRGIKQNSDLDNLKSNLKSGNIVESLSSFFAAGGKFN
jgi:hypothetical protein